MNLKYIFENIEKLNLDHALFLPTPPWSRDSKALVLDPDDVENPEDPEDDPKAAKEAGLIYVIMMQDLNDIMFNIEEQIRSPEFNDYLDALNYYIDNDAFMKL